MPEVRKVSLYNGERLCAVRGRSCGGFLGLRDGSAATKIHTYPIGRADGRAQKGKAVCRGNEIAYAAEAARRIKHQVRSESPTGLDLSPGHHRRRSVDVHKRLEPRGRLGMTAILLFPFIDPAGFIRFPHMRDSAVSKAIEKETRTCP